MKNTGELKTFVNIGENILILNFSDKRIHGTIWTPSNAPATDVFDMSAEFLRCDAMPEDDVFEICDSISAEWAETVLQMFFNEDYREPLPIGAIMLVQEIKEAVPGFLSGNPDLLQQVILSLLEEIKRVHKDMGKTPAYFVYFGNDDIQGDSGWYDAFKRAKGNLFHVIEPDAVEDSCFLAVFSSEARTADELEKQAALSEEE